MTLDEVLNPKTQRQYVHVKVHSDKDKSDTEK